MSTSPDASKCIYARCVKNNHDECLQIYRQKHKESSRKLYHEKYKIEFYICECGEKVSKCNRTHPHSDKHKRLLNQKMLLINLKTQ